MSGPAAVVLAGAVTMIVASRTPEAMVVDDYYRQGRAINASLHRDDIARALGLHAQVSVGADGLVRVKVENSRGLALDPETLQLSLIHPNLAERDLKAVLKRTQLDSGAIEYQVHLGVLPNKHWGVLIEDPQAQWRLLSSQRAVLPGTVELAPPVMPAD
jgi:hypothetical protein